MRLFFAVLVCASWLDAAAVMRGKLVRDRPDGDPIAGVSVAAPGIANPTLSRDDGSFSLEFPYRQPGDRVRIEPTYAGFEVVNWPQLNVVLAGDYQGSNVLIVIFARAGAERHIGRMHLASHHREEAGAEFTEALDIYSKFAERDPAQYGPMVRVVKDDL